MFKQIKPHRNHQSKFFFKDYASQFKDDTTPIFLKFDPKNQGSQKEKAFLQDVLYRNERNSKGQVDARTEVSELDDWKDFQVQIFDPQKVDQYKKWFSHHDETTAEKYFHSSHENQEKQFIEILKSQVLDEKFQTFINDKVVNPAKQVIFAENEPASKEYQNFIREQIRKNYGYKMQECKVSNENESLDDGEFKRNAFCQHCKSHGGRARLECFFYESNCLIIQKFFNHVERELRFRLFKYDFDNPEENCKYIAEHSLGQRISGISGTDDDTKECWSSSYISFKQHENKLFYFSPKNDCTPLIQLQSIDIMAPEQEPHDEEIITIGNFNKKQAIAVIFQERLYEYKDISRKVAHQNEQGNQIDSKERSRFHFLGNFFIVLHEKTKNHFHYEYSYVGKEGIIERVNFQHSFENQVGKLKDLFTFNSLDHMMHNQIRYSTISTDNFKLLDHCNSTDYDETEFESLKCDEVHILSFSCQSWLAFQTYENEENHEHEFAPIAFSSEELNTEKLHLQALCNDLNSVISQRSFQWSYNVNSRHADDERTIIVRKTKHLNSIRNGIEYCLQYFPKPDQDENKMTQENQSMPVADKFKRIQEDQDIRCCVIKNDVFNQILIVVNEPQRSDENEPPIKILKLETSLPNMNMMMRHDLSMVQQRILSILQKLRGQEFTQLMISSQIANLIRTNQYVFYFNSNGCPWSINNQETAEFTHSDQQQYIIFKDEEQKLIINKRFFGSLNLSREAQVNHFLDETRNSFNKVKSSNQEGQVIFKQIQDTQGKVLGQAFMNQYGIEHFIVRNDKFNLGQSKDANYLNQFFNVTTNKKWLRNMNEIQIKIPTVHLKEDDRFQIPLLAIQHNLDNQQRKVKRVFLIVFNTKFMSIDEYKLISLRSEDLLQFSDIQLSFSSSPRVIGESKEEKELPPGYEKYEEKRQNWAKGFQLLDEYEPESKQELDVVKQNYQIAIWYDQFRVLKVFEYEIQWSFNPKNYGSWDNDKWEKPKVSTSLVGMKILIQQMAKKNQNLKPEDQIEKKVNFHFLPLIEDKEGIVGTQAVFQHEVCLEHKKVQDQSFLNLKKFGSKDYQYSNRFTAFGYKVYNREMSDEPKQLLIEMRIHPEILNSKIFGNYEKFIILQEQAQALLSMVTIDINKLLNAPIDLDLKHFNFFDNLEFLNGQSLCEYYIYNSTKFQRLLKQNSQKYLRGINQFKDVEYREFYMREHRLTKNLLQLVLENDTDKSRIEFLEAISLINLIQPNAQSLITPLEACFENNKKNFYREVDLTVGVIFKALNEYDMQNFFSYSLQTKCLTYMAEDNFQEDYLSKYFVKFFERTSKKGNRYQFEKVLDDETLPISSDKEIECRNFQFDRENFASQNLNQLIIDAIKQFEKKDNNFQVKHSFVDFNLFNYKIKCSKYLKFRSEKYSHYYKQYLEQNKKWEKHQQCRHQKPSDPNFPKCKLNQPKDCLREEPKQNLAMSWESMFTKHDQFLLRKQYMDSEMSSTALAKILRVSLTKHPNLADESIVIRNLTNFLYQECSYLKCKIDIIVFLLYFIPMLAGSFTSSKNIAITCTTIQLFAWLYFLILEIMQFRTECLSGFGGVMQQIRSYFERYSNYVDISFLSVSIWHIATRYFANFSVEIHLSDLTQETSQTIMSRLQRSLDIILCAMKLISLLRINDSALKLEALISRTARGLLSTIFIYFIIIIMISTLFISNEVTFDSEDYTDLPSWVFIPIQLFKNSIGSIQSPNFSYWTGQKLEDEKKLIVFLIWFLSYFNIIISYIILQNYMIAVVLEHYEDGKGKINQNNYLHKARVNQEVYVLLDYIYRTFGYYSNKYDILIIHYEDKTVVEEEKPSGSELFAQSDDKSLKELMLGIKDEIKNMAKLRENYDESDLSNYVRKPKDIEEERKGRSNSFSDRAQIEVDKLSEQVKLLQRLRILQDDIKHNNISTRQQIQLILQNQQQIQQELRTNQEQTQKDLRKIMNMVKKQQDGIFIQKESSSICKEEGVSIISVGDLDLEPIEEVRTKKKASYSLQVKKENKSGLRVQNINTKGFPSPGQRMRDESLKSFGARQDKRSMTQQLKIEEYKQDKNDQSYFSLKNQQIDQTNLTSPNQGNISSKVFSDQSTPDERALAKKKFIDSCKRRKN